MSRYAAGTTVSPEKSRAEIEHTLKRYAADGFGYAMDRQLEVTPAQCRQGSCEREGRTAAECMRLHSWEVTKERRFHREVVAISFRMKERRIRLDVPMPAEHEVKTKAQHEAAVRQRWRALALVIKAKLEAVASGVSTLEHEFLANVVTPDGRTIGDNLVPRLSAIAEKGFLLPARGEGSGT